MKLKTKLYLSFLFLFSLIVLLSGLGTYFIRALAEDSRAIMQDNFQTLDFMHSLNTGLDRVASALPESRGPGGLNQEVGAELELCRSIIESQLVNITEPGEHKLSRDLSGQFQTLLRRISLLQEREPFDTAFYLSHILPKISEIKDLSARIFSINQETLLRKNARANRTAENASLSMAIFGASGVIVSLLFILGIPSYLFQPLARLNEGIKQIAAKNYGYPLAIDSKDELGEVAASLSQMAQRLDEYDKSNYALLLSEKKRIDAIINQMPEAIIGFDETPTVLFANRLACELLHLNQEEVKGMQVQSQPPFSTLIQSFAADFALAGKESLEPKPVQMVYRGKQRLFSREIIPITVERSAQEGGGIINMGFVVVLTDITSFSERDSAKTHFIATISHELKSPLSSIKMSLKLLNDGRAGILTQDQLELLGSIKDDSDRLLKITGELLKMAQVETGNLQLDSKPIDPAHMVEVSILALQQQAQAKGIQIVRKLEADVPVVGDGDKTTWVLINFLSNAIRYSPEQGTVFLSVTRQPGNMLRFSVQDHGPGIDPRFQGKVFEKYYKVPGSDQAGTGLGLAISQEFIKAMGGSIGVESTPNEGAKFWFTLPLAVP